MQSIDTQINTAERALGERMIEHALVIVQGWLSELGENNLYEEALQNIRSRYQELFSEWLVTNEHEEQGVKLDALTTDAYRLVDAVYVALRLHRGLSPVMRGYNPDNITSVAHYYAANIQLKKEDYDHLHEILNDPDRAKMALLAVGGLARNLRECFSEEGLMALIDGISCENSVLAEQCMASAMMLLVHYDVRIDFFPDLQDAFFAAINAKPDGMHQAFETLCAIVRAIGMNASALRDNSEHYNRLPEEVRGLMDMVEKQTGGMQSMLPKSEYEYMSKVVSILPQTWVYDIVVGEDEQRRTALAVVYLSVGKMDLAWDHIDAASQWLLKRLRRYEGRPKDYINYGHCLLLQGDKMLAMEYYRKARSQCAGAKEFFALFRPDRHALVEQGVPLDIIYLIEDQLLNR